MLRRQASERIQARQLPGCAPAMTRGGPGAGYCCDLCGQPITAEDIEFELVFAPDPEPSTVRLHSSCHVAWDVERIRNG